MVAKKAPAKGKKLSMKKDSIKDLKSNKDVKGGGALNLSKPASPCDPGCTKQC
jgi:hypothetical protein